jgi:two-component system cell cycle sensor histidine kinase/response regulator CckA
MATNLERRTIRVLIVDDEQPVRTLEARVLQSAGYETVSAADGPEALRIAERQGPFDLVLADVVMPGMTGDDMARRLRRLEPDLRVLYVTGYSDQLFQDQTTLAAYEAFVEKPVSPEGLLEAVSLILFGQTRRP